ncbi:MAG TPA: nucleotide disphospho-sugar-binding domain-containing protein [Thermoleophilaceae bacterium]
MTARILVYQSASSGNTFPAVDTLLELHSRGHEVHLRGGEAHVERLAALGIRSAPVDPSIERFEFDDWRGRSQVDGLRRLLRAYAGLAELEVPDLQRAISEVRPDALFVDVNCHGGMFAAQASGLPWAVFCPYPPAFRSVDVPPHGMGWRRARGPLGRTRDRVWRAVGDRLAAQELRPFNRLRTDLGLAPVERFDEQYLESDVFIAYTAEPFEYPRGDWPANVRLVGPGLWEPPADPPAWLEAETRPIVLVTASTAYQRDDKLIATALAALAGEPFAVVATTGALDPAAFQAPANARVEPFLPHRPVLERAACVVCHGGHGITVKALSAGVPVCVVPFGRDQFDVARRVEVADAGVRLHHRRLSPERLRAAVDRAVAKRPGAERVARSFAGAGGPGAAADAVEELVG